MTATVPAGNRRWLWADAAGHRAPPARLPAALAVQRDPAAIPAFMEALAGAPATAVRGSTPPWCSPAEPPRGRRVGLRRDRLVYCLNRAGRETGYHAADRRDALRRFAAGCIDWPLALDPRAQRGAERSALLFGCVCALAELQQAVSGLIRTPRPLRLVLDRRPFI